ncbi:hypothetical protein Bcav_1127 [Beutenbergia cavernae DSM 12333]|uniref:Histone acetyltransferase Rv0428c-like SH3 domain-containing protein n=1 Tax=Beutenbergia cavernae (strain ATCC BAA-8 / DSM 12333 / CCUG 43141 / JCM 11478 / NBRC 16432 / NCIMB 13614 / HKI 0122) TaxID=471853 RepID=C5C0Y3_BEUC1|nr:hypothetical protein [Beutenbergia cavernae]ACQ79387.1 hypothetical protein Bcav_1127 [Beutenbergia cavernae DSM 12333]
MESPRNPDDDGRSRADVAFRGHAVGERVVVRYRLPEPDGAGRTLTDALGEITSITRDAVVVATRRGDVRVPTAAVVALKRVPPPPARRPRPEPG